MRIIVFFILFIFTCVSVNCEYSNYGKKLPKLHRNIKIYNPRKFSRLKYINSRKANIKESYTDQTYTVFSPISIRLRDVPNSPYFNVEPDGGYKPRVKKVLTDVDHHVIRKRSVDSNTTIPETRRKISKLHKIKRTHTHSEEQKDVKEISRKKKKLSKHHRHHKNNRQVDNIKSANKSKPLRIKENKISDDTHRKVKKTGREVGRSKRKKAEVRKRDRNEPHVDKTVRNGKVLVRKKRLIAAKDAMIEDYPYVVSIQKASEHWCTGALLNPRLVITTANCIWKSKRMSRLKVRAGSRYVDRGGQVARVQEVMKHPYWSIRRNPDYDVGLLFLDRNIKFSDKVHGVDLPNHAMLPPFEDAWVTSWGAERRDGVFENKGNTLQVYHARLLDLDKCNNVTQRYGVTVTDNFICLAQTGKRAPCTRDTGAPAVSDGIVWGLASWGLRRLCGTERYPAMFSYLGARSNIDFITNATHYLMSDHRYYPFPDRYEKQHVATSKRSTKNIMEY